MADKKGAKAAEDAPDPAAATNDPPIIEQSNEAVIHLRDTAKWVITLFTSLAVVIMAGTQLSSIGSLDAPAWMTDHRLLLAVASGVITLIAIGVIIWRALRILLCEPVDIGVISSAEANPESVSILSRKEMRQYVSLVNSPGRLNGKPTIAEFLAIPTTINSEWDAAADNDKTPASTFKNLTQQSVDYNTELRILKALIRYQGVKDEFQRSIKWLLGAGLVGGISIGLLAWAANPGEQPASVAAFRAPVAAIAYLSEENQQQFSALFGSECVKAPFDVVVLSAGTDSARIVSIPSDSCKVGIASVTLNEVFPKNPVEIPNGTPNADGSGAS